MCKRRKSISKVVKRKQRKEKKKLTCCQKCKRRIRLWLCRRVKRCVKRIIFGDPDPYLEEFQVAGVNLGDIRDTFKGSKHSLENDKQIKTEKKPTVVTLFRNVNNKSNKSNPMKDAIANEWDKYSFSKSVKKKVKSFVDDFRERNMYLGLSKDSKLNLNEDDKRRFQNLAEKYEHQNKQFSQNDLAFFKSIEKRKRKFSLTASKEILLRNMVEDYKMGKFSLSKIPDIKKLNVGTFSKADLNKVLSYYESEKKKKKLFDHLSKKRKFKDTVEKINSKNKKPLAEDLEILKNMDNNEIRKKFSLTTSKEKLFRQLMADYDKGSFSISGISNKIKTGSKEFHKKDLNKILEHYKVQKKKKSFTFIKQSKLKQLQSDLRARIGFL